MSPTEPRITKGLIKWLQESYKPRCYDGTETLEEHLKFAGKVELVATLSDIHERQVDGEDAIAALARQEAEALEAHDALAEDYEAAHVALHSHTLERH